MLWLNSLVPARLSTNPKCVQVGYPATRVRRCLPLLRWSRITRETVPPLKTFQRRCRTDVNQSQSELEWVWLTLDDASPSRCGRTRFVKSCEICRSPPSKITSAEAPKTSPPEGGMNRVLVNNIQTLLAKREAEEQSVTEAPKSRLTIAMIAVGLIGAALLYGDGVITPAISVLSATEGLTVAAHWLAPFSVPLTILILVLLFAFQRKGTESVAKLFGLSCWCGS